MSYEPKPVDTSSADVTILASVAEKLAEHVHDLWAKGRLSEGWQYGPVHDGQKKTTPNLVEYGKLPEKEKDYDRRSAIEPVKVLLAEGFALTAPGKTPADATVAAPTAPAEDAVPADDMLDGPHLDAGHPLLNEALTFISSQTYSKYSKANDESTVFQNRFRRAARSTVIAGVLSVLIAIWQLTYPPHGIWHVALPAAELFLVVWAIGRVTFALLYQKLHLRWLTERSKAEHYRAAKFHFLLDPRTWDVERAKQSRAEFGEHVREIDTTNAESLAQWLTEVPKDPAQPSQLTRDRRLHEAITQYYLARRLSGQAKYLKRKAHQMHSDDGFSKTIGHVLYFLVLAFVFAHAIADLSGDAASSKLLVMLAAMIPVLSAAIHTYRAGKETARNHLRFEASYKRLSAIQGGLEQSTSQAGQIRLMLASEAVLASEHQQWLQLMYECEWFG